MTAQCDEANDSRTLARFVVHALETKPNAWKSVEGLKAACALAAADTDRLPSGRDLDIAALTPTRMAAPVEGS